MFETVILVLLLGFVLLFFFVLTSAFAGFLQTRVPFVRSPKADVLKALSRLPLTENSIFFDLGSGDGAVVFAVEREFKLKAKGFEKTFWTHYLAKLKAWWTGSSAEFLREDFFKADWSGVGVIYAYLYPPLMEKVEKKFISETLAGSFLVVRDFPLPGLKPFEVVVIDSKHEVFLYCNEKSS